MRLIILASTTLLALSVNCQAAEKVKPLTEDELGEVIKAATALKGQCISKKETDCPKADAVMKLLRYTLRNENSPHKDYLKQYGGIFLNSFVDGYIEVKARSEQQGK
jgi:hypothetical protein